MKVLSLYHSQTKNTLKVAETIERAAVSAGCEVKTLQAKPGAETVRLLEFDLVFIGSGIYGWLPGKAMIEWLGDRAKESMEEFGGSGLFKPGSPRLAGKYVAVYCTFGGSHTGINEAIPAVKYMGQLFDHLGFTNAAEWYVPGAYHVPKLLHHNIHGRLGDISHRPDDHDLASIAENVKGLIASIEPSIKAVKTAP